MDGAKYSYGITIADVLQIDALTDLQLIAGIQGINRLVTSVNVMEVPDIDNWVVEHQLLLTAAYSIRDDLEAQEALIPLLAKKNLSGLIIKVPRYLSKIPDSMIREANALNFPLINMPQHLSHPLIIREVYGALAKKQLESLQLSAKLHHSLTELVLQGGSFREVCCLLRDQYTHSVYIVNRFLEEMGAAQLDQEAECELTYLLRIAQDNGLLLSRKIDHHIFCNSEGKTNILIVAPVLSGKYHHGYIISLSDTPLLSERYLISLEQATLIVALIFSNQIAIREAEIRSHTGFLSDWFGDNIASRAVFEQRASAIDWKFDGRYALLLISQSENEKLDLSEKTFTYDPHKQESLKQVLRNALSYLDNPIHHYIGAIGNKIVLLLKIPPKYSVSEIMGYLKGKSSLIIFDRYANLKYKYGNRHFWCRGYYVSTVGKNEKKITEYIANQLTEDKLQDQISLKEYVDPFTGNRETERKR
jgi:REP element-mobilizing transposase RayT